MNSHFTRVGNLNPSRSLFNLSYEKKFSCDMGQLIPVLCDEVVPGDVWDIGASAIVRFQPLVAPVLHQVDLYYHVFFVPYRILWEDWEDFISGGPDGNLVPTLPRWAPLMALEVGKGSLWDYLGFPVLPAAPVAATDSLPMDFPKRAYINIWNEYYRDETLQAEYALTDPLTMPLYKNWPKDYFTSALLWQQRGTAPAIPLSGTTAAVWDTARFIDGTPGTSLAVNANGDPALPNLYMNEADARNNVFNMFNSNIVDLGVGDPINISDLRLSIQVQKWLERNARAGARYTSFLKAHFGVSPNDERLDRPEYIGGMKSPVIFTEVLQTSETGTTPQGNLAGHGLSVAGERISKYHAQEFGLIMGIMSIVPKPEYQQGINRQWLRVTKEEFYFPEYANLSEQEIKNAELMWVDNESANQTPFGFTGAYDEMRVKQSMICGEFRDTYDYWHLGRQFAMTPTLNSTFIKCVPRKDIFAVPSEPGCLVQFGNIIKALRPMPIIAEPGVNI